MNNCVKFYKDNISQRASLRGIKKCPSCGALNGQRALLCRNIDCDLRQKTLASIKPFDPVQLITTSSTNTNSQQIYNNNNSSEDGDTNDNDYKSTPQSEEEEQSEQQDNQEIKTQKNRKQEQQLYSLRTREKLINPRTFVAITEQILAVESSNTEIVSRNAVCYVETCKYDVNNLNQIGCKHVNACIRSKPQQIRKAEVYQIDRDILWSLNVNESKKKKLWNLCLESECNEQIPPVQRINVNTFVVKCPLTSEFPVARLHVSVYSNQITNPQKRGMFNCACKFKSENQLESENCDEEKREFGGVKQNESSFRKNSNQPNNPGQKQRQQFNHKKPNEPSKGIANNQVVINNNQYNKPNKNPSNIPSTGDLVTYYNNNLNNRSNLNNKQYKAEINQKNEESGSEATHCDDIDLENCFEGRNNNDDVTKLKAIVEVGAGVDKSTDNYFNEVETFLPLRQEKNEGKMLIKNSVPDICDHLLLLLVAILSHSNGKSTYSSFLDTFKYFWQPVKQATVIVAPEMKALNGVYNLQDVETFKDVTSPKVVYSTDSKDSNIEAGLSIGEHYPLEVVTAAGGIYNVKNLDNDTKVNTLAIDYNLDNIQEDIYKLKRTEIASNIDCLESVLNSEEDSEPANKLYKLEPSKKMVLSQKKVQSLKRLYSLEEVVSPMSKIGLSMKAIHSVKEDNILSDKDTLQQVQTLKEVLNLKEVQNLNHLDANLNCKNNELLRKLEDEEDSLRISPDTTTSNLFRVTNDLPSSINYHDQLTNSSTSPTSFHFPITELTDTSLQSSTSLDQASYPLRFEIDNSVIGIDPEDDTTMVQALSSSVETNIETNSPNNSHDFFNFTEELFGEHHIPDFSDIIMEVDHNANAAAAGIAIDHHQQQQHHSHHNSDKMDICLTKLKRSNDLNIKDDKLFSSSATINNDDDVYLPTLPTTMLPEPHPPQSPIDLNENAFETMELFQLNDHNLNNHIDSMLQSSHLNIVDEELEENIRVNDEKVEKKVKQPKEESSENDKNDKDDKIGKNVLKTEVEKEKDIVVLSSNNQQHATNICLPLTHKDEGQQAPMPSINSKQLLTINIPHEKPMNLLAKMVRVLPTTITTLPTIAANTVTTTTTTTTMSTPATSTTLAGETTTISTTSTTLPLTGATTMSSQQQLPTLVGGNTVIGSITITNQMSSPIRPTNNNIVQMNLIGNNNNNISSNNNNNNNINSKNIIIGNISLNSNDSIIESVNSLSSIGNGIDYVNGNSNMNSNVINTSCNSVINLPSQEMARFITFNPSTATTINRIKAINSVNSFNNDNSRNVVVAGAAVAVSPSAVLPIALNNITTTPITATTAAATTFTFSPAINQQLGSSNNINHLNNNINNNYNDHLSINRNNNHDYINSVNKTIINNNNNNRNIKTCYNILNSINSINNTNGSNSIIKCNINNNNNNILNYGSNNYNSINNAISNHYNINNNPESNNVNSNSNNSSNNLGHNNLGNSNVIHINSSPIVAGNNTVNGGSGSGGGISNIIASGGGGIIGSLAGGGTAAIAIVTPSQLMTVPTTTNHSSINIPTTTTTTTTTNTALITPNSTPVLAYNEWLEHIIEVLNDSIIIQSCENIRHSFHVYEDIFTYFSKSFSMNSKKRLPNMTSVIKTGRHEGLVKYTWFFNHSPTVQRIFTTKNVKLEMEKLYELGEDGSFKPFQANIIFPTIPSTRGRLLHPKRTIYKAYMQFNGNEEKALPFHISQIVPLKNGLKLDWLPMAFPRSRFGLMTLEFCVSVKDNE